MKMIYVNYYIQLIITRLQEDTITFIYKYKGHKDRKSTSPILKDTNGDLYFTTRGLKFYLKEMIECPY